ncbi:MAG: beta family protein [Acinetobacter sp.]|nr:beta family protein [Acinetobacter sp.]
MKVIPKYIPILKAKKGELSAYEHLSQSIKNNTLPIFEMPTENWEKTQKQRIDFVDSKVLQINKTLDKNSTSLISLDFSFWNYKDQLLENQEHIFSYTFNQLTDKGYTLIPVIGYDRWHNESDRSYQANIKALDFKEIPFFIIRLDGEALEHIHEPFFFEEQIEEILNGLKVTIDKCLFLIDHNNIFGKSPTQVTEEIIFQIKLITELNPLSIAISSHSMPKSINKLVPNHDSSNLLFRTEEDIWKNTIKKLNNPHIIYSDYGIIANDGEERTGGNNSTNNGKIRYTTQDHLFVVRGHPFGKDGGKHVQMHDLAKKVVESNYFENMSWGDSKILECSQTHKAPGSPMNWISYELNHHVTYMLEEVITPLTVKFA